MNKLVQLGENINNYNLYGSSSTRFAPLKIAILYKKSHQELCKQIAQDLDCQKTHASLELMGLSGYSIMRSGKVSHLELHLISSLTDEETIQDERFLRRKKIIDKLRSDKQCIFLCLDQQYSKGNSKQRQQILELKRVDSSITKNIIWRGQARLFYIDIVKTWENMHRCQIMGILTKLKAIMKEQQKSLSRSRQWIQVKQRTADQLSYALQLITKASDYLTCSLEGYYSKQASHFQIEYSIHWQIMDVFEDLWKQQTEKINKQLEKMPLSYIGESLRMSSCHPISGFIPQACFLRVFKPILLNLAEDVLFCLEGAKFKVIQNIQIIYEYYFTKTTIKDELIERQIHTVEKICDQFLKQVQSAIYAQINYVYAPSQSFWEMRNVQSNLYSQQQQANIQIKYIGKVYVKRVYDSIKDSIPRFVGQGLLRRVSKYFRENSLNNMLEIVKNCEFKISLSKGEIEEIRSREQKLKKYDKVFQYFSLKVSSAFKIKNLMQKNQKRWRQMYHKDKPTQNNPKQNSRQNKGFVGWVKGLFKTKPKRQKRSNSVGKHNQSSISSTVVEQANIQKKSSEKIEELAITEKNWILLLNTNKKIEQEKLQKAACQGFPDRLRPSIWFWLATRASEEKQLKMKQIIQKGKMDPQIVRQIEKDLGRTPPPQLFKNNKLRSCLRRVLSAYSLIDQEIKYTQGMNFMVATALATLSHWGARQDYLVDKNDKVNKDELEQKSFIILKFLMLKQGIRRVMFIEREYMAEICFRIQQKIKQMNINVWKMIEGSGFTCEIIFGSILFAGLATWSKHLQVSRRIMDILLVKGFSILYKIVAGVAVMSEQQMKNLRQQQIYDFLRHKSLDDFYQRAGNQGLSQLFLSL